MITKRIVRVATSESWYGKEMGENEIGPVIGKKGRLTKKNSLFSNNE